MEKLLRNSLVQASSKKYQNVAQYWSLVSSDFHVREIQLNAKETLNQTSDEATL